MSNLAYLQELLAKFPRIPLAEYPTPLEFLPRISQELGRQVYVKRDDGIGPGLGGNKTRKLEYLLAEARARGHRKVVTFGGIQSNHVRITAAAARGLGMEPHIFFFEARPEDLLGNQLLNTLLDARSHFIPLGVGGDGGMTLETTIRLVRLLARLWVGKHYFIPVGGHSWRGCLGYVKAALEIQQQAVEADIEDCWLVTAAGTGGTLAGLVAGLKAIESPIRPLGIDVGKLWKKFSTSIEHLVQEIWDRLGIKKSIQTGHLPLIESHYSDPVYGKPSKAGSAAIQRLAQAEGILLDPIYTGKAFAGMLELTETGKLGKDEPIIFLHTGGLPGLFAFEGDQQPFNRE
jgi:D-cysteine desulfhydrase family pyridoxal phosphate-dependent enzyme